MNSFPALRALQSPHLARSLALALSALAPAAGRGADANAAPDSNEPRAGHSWHGEAFNEGPRQRAYLMQGMPRIDFPATTSVPLAQRFINQGVGQLHGFWYFEAERSFREAHRLDTNCAIAFWGMAMANVKNEARARQFITNAAALKPSASRREQLFIDALHDFYVEPKSADKDKKRDDKQRRRDLVRAYENLVTEFPADLEAKAFLIYQIWDNSGFGNRTDLAISSHLPVDALARQLLAADPLHPVHHYRIHLWDPEKPFNALDSAARCGQGSPGIAHMWHMPGHTYAKVSRHADAAYQQEASARVDHAHMIRDRVLPDQIHNYAHNNDWLVESFSFEGRVRDAIALARNMVELPRLMKTNSAKATNPMAHDYSYASSSWSLGRNRLLQILPKFELWDELLALSGTPYLESTELPLEQARLAHALGLAHFHQGSATDLTNQIRSLEQVLERVREERRGATDFAETQARQDKKSGDDITRAMTDALKTYSGTVDRIESFLAELRALAGLHAGDTNAFANQLERAKDIPKERLALIHWGAGDTNKAVDLAREISTSATNQFLQTALYADLLQRSGQTNEAREAFEKLRSIHPAFDLDLPVIRRLTPIAQTLRLPADWRQAKPQTDDVGERPPLDSLGPLYWTPPPAPGWTLADARGKRHSLRDYRGKPVVMIFYLGRGCSHCMEQLNAFAPAAKDFEDAGIALVAVSTDTSEGLAKTLRSDGAAPFPFPLLSDAALEVFKSYRAFDDFEGMALHGTFLIDGVGALRWQDISYEPFQHPKFLLAEARRLLTFGAAPKVTRNRSKPARERLQPAHLTAKP